MRDVIDSPGGEKMGRSDDVDEETEAVEEEAEQEEEKDEEEEGEGKRGNGQVEEKTNRTKELRSTVST